MAIFLQVLQSTQQAERRMRDALKTLSDDYTVINELVVDGEWARRLRSEGYSDVERRPDFIVLGPELGVVSVEVKDWNLVNNQYRWTNQNFVAKMPSGDSLVNPWHKAWIYEVLLHSMLKDRGIPMTVRGLVAFPRLSRAEFMRGFDDRGNLANPQLKQLVDPSTTVFSDDLDSPEDLKSALMRGRKRSVRFSSSELASAASAMIPAEVVLGDGSQRRARDNQVIRLLSDEQVRWATEIPTGRHALLDVAGSGKTNVLLSRALRLSERFNQQGTKNNVMVLTFSPKLVGAMQRILKDKLAGRPIPENIHLLDVGSAMREALAEFGELSTLDAKATREWFVEWMTDYVESGEDPPTRSYDALLIDEIQDFEVGTPALEEAFLRGDELFVTGDLAQRVHARQLRLELLGLDLDRAAVAAKYLMYRCPKGIARTAHHFVMGDPLLSEELRDFGRGEVHFASAVDAWPEFVTAESPADVHKCVERLVRASDESEGLALGDVMIICDPDAVEPMVSFLNAAGLPATTRLGHRSEIHVTDFVSSKGLEADMVVVAGFEKLPTRAALGHPQDDAEALSLSRRQVYVALTRTRRRLIVVFLDADSRLAIELRAAYREATS